MYFNAILQKHSNFGHYLKSISYIVKSYFKMLSDFPSIFNIFFVINRFKIAYLKYILRAQLLRSLISCFKQCLNRVFEIYFETTSTRISHFMYKQCLNRVFKIYFKNTATNLSLK